MVEGKEKLFPLSSITILVLLIKFETVKKKLKVNGIQ